MLDFFFIGLKFFDCISGYKTYLACALPVAMDFYLWGIKDYCKYPNRDNLVKFEAKGYNLWGQKVKKVAMDVFVRKVVEFCYDREKKLFQPFPALLGAQYAPEGYSMRRSPGIVPPILEFHCRRRCRKIQF